MDSDWWKERVVQAVSDAAGGARRALAKIGSGPPPRRKSLRSDESFWTCLVAIIAILGVYYVLRLLRDHEDGDDDDDTAAPTKDSGAGENKKGLRVSTGTGEGRSSRIPRQVSPKSQTIRDYLDKSTVAQQRRRGGQGGGGGDGDEEDLDPLELARLNGLLDGKKAKSRRHAVRDLIRYAGQGRTDGVVKVFLLNEDYNLHVDDQNKQGVTALIQASFDGRLSMVRFLIDARADPNAQTNTGGTALMSAAGRGHLDVVKALVKHKAKVDAPTMDGSTALMAACNQSQGDVVRYLVQRAGADTHLRKRNGSTALTITAEVGPLSTMQLLVEHGANPDARTKDGSSALMFASYYGNLDIVRWLVEICSVDIDASMVTPIEGAPTHVIEYGEEVKGRGIRKTAYDWAMSAGNGDVASYLKPRIRPREEKSKPRGGATGEPSGASGRGGGGSAPKQEAPTPAAAVEADDGGNAEPRDKAEKKAGKPKKKKGKRRNPVIEKTELFTISETKAEATAASKDTPPNAQSLKKNPSAKSPASESSDGPAAGAAAAPKERTNAATPIDAPPQRVSKLEDVDGEEDPVFFDEVPETPKEPPNGDADDDAEGDGASVQQVEEPKKDQKEYEAEMEKKYKAKMEMELRKRLEAERLKIQKEEEQKLLDQKTRLADEKAKMEDEKAKIEAKLADERAKIKVQQERLDREEQRIERRKSREEPRVEDVKGDPGRDRARPEQSAADDEPRDLSDALNISGDFTPEEQGFVIGDDDGLQRPGALSVKSGDKGQADLIILTPKSAVSTGSSSDKEVESSQ